MRRGREKRRKGGDGNRGLVTRRLVNRGLADCNRDGQELAAEIEKGMTMGGRRRTGEGGKDKNKGQETESSEGSERESQKRAAKGKRRYVNRDGD